MSPRLLHKLSNKFIMTISVGAECSVAMDSAGLVYVWGRADSGQVSKVTPYVVFVTRIVHFFTTPNGFYTNSFW